MKVHPLLLPSASCQLTAVFPAIYSVLLLAAAFQRKQHCPGWKHLCPTMQGCLLPRWRVCNPAVGREDCNSIVTLLAYNNMQWAPTTLPYFASPWSTSGEVLRNSKPQYKKAARLPCCQAFSHALCFYHADTIQNLACSALCSLTLRLYSKLFSRRLWAASPRVATETSCLPGTETLGS